MPDLYPLDDDWTEADDENWLSEQEQSSLPTPEEDFDAFFESWQDAAEDAHMRQALDALEAQGRRLLARESASVRDEAGAANAYPRL